MTLTSYGVSTSTSSQTYDSVSEYRKNNPWLASTLTWTEIVSSTPEDWAGFIVNAKVEYGDNAFFYFAVGAAASETIIACINIQSYTADPGTMHVPIPIPSGTRISVAQVSWATRGTWVSIMPHKAADFPESPPFSIMELGPIYLDGSSSNYVYGKLLTPPTANHTKSAWTEISFSGTYSTPNNAINGDSLDQDYDYLGLLLRYYDTFHTVHRAYIFDLAYGASGSETVFLENIPLVMPSYNYLSGYECCPLWFKWGRAAGDRIAIRYQAQDYTKCDFLATLYGLR